MVDACTPFKKSPCIMAKSVICKHDSLISLVVRVTLNLYTAEIYIQNTAVLFNMYQLHLVKKKTHLCPWFCVDLRVYLFLLERGRQHLASDLLLFV